MINLLWTPFTISQTMVIVIKIIHFTFDLMFRGVGCRMIQIVHISNRKACGSFINISLIHLSSDCRYVYAITEWTVIILDPQLIICTYGLCLGIIWIVHIRTLLISYVDFNIIIWIHVWLIFREWMLVGSCRDWIYCNCMAFHFIWMFIADG